MAAQSGWRTGLIVGLTALAAGAAVLVGAASAGGNPPAGPAAALHAAKASPNLSDHALRMLIEGNERFVTGRSNHPNTDVFRITDTGGNGQRPFAAVLTCADSRLAVERLFDRGIGDLFVVRVAGNICDPNEAGSIEYACEHLGTQLVVVMGHTRCGAVKAAVAGGEAPANIATLLDNIEPAVKTVRFTHPDLAGDELVDAVVRENVWQTIADMFATSSTMREMVERGAVRVVGAVYDVHTGRVDWMGQHPAQSGLLKDAAAKPATAAAAPVAPDKPATEKVATDKPAPSKTGFVRPPAGATPTAAKKPADGKPDDHQGQSPSGGASHAGHPHP